MGRSTHRFSLAIAVGAIASFLANTAHRWITFNDFIPNTIHAERWPPYADQPVHPRLHNPGDPVLQPCCTSGTPRQLWHGLRDDILGRDALATDFCIVTPTATNYTKRSVEQTRTALGLDSISFLVRDVAGLALGNPSINILDSALLNNRELAGTRTGYAEFDTCLRSKKPDVIKTLQIWSDLSGIYPSLRSSPPTTLPWWWMQTGFTCAMIASPPCSGTAGS